VQSYFLLLKWLSGAVCYAPHSLFKAQGVCGWLGYLWKTLPVKGWTHLKQAALPQAPWGPYSILRKVEVVDCGNGEHLDIEQTGVLVLNLV